MVGCPQPDLCKWRPCTVFNSPCISYYHRHIFESKWVCFYSSLTLVVSHPGSEEGFWVSTDQEGGSSGPPVIIQRCDIMPFCSCIFNTCTSSLSWAPPAASPASFAGQRDSQTHFLLPVSIQAIFLTWWLDRHFLNISSSPFHSSGRVVNWTHRPNLQSEISPGPRMGGRDFAGQALLFLKVDL